MSPTVETNIEVLTPHVHRYQLAAGRILTWRQVLAGWREDGSFRHGFNQILAESPFAAFRWETPGVTGDDLDSEFEFVLIQATRLLVPPDPAGYVEYFVEPGGGVEADHGVVCFPNLGNNAWLVVPSPRADDSAYGHLAAFCRNAPSAQRDALWRLVGERAEAWLAGRKLWLNTHGGGVDWLHVRFDSTPKYYGHEPYRRLR